MESTKIKPKFKYVQYKNKELEYANNCDKQELNDQSQFPIGAVSECFTLYLILLLQQKKMLNIQDSLATYIKSKENNFNDILLLDLINHQSGLKIIKNEEQKKYSNVLSIIKKYIHDDLIIASKGTCQYSNLDYLLLGAVIEKVTELNYLDALEKYLTKPLKLKHTFLDKTNTKLYGEHKTKLSKEQKKEIYFAQSAGGLCSTISDLKTLSETIQSVLTKESQDILKQSFICFVSDNEYIIKQYGAIYGSEVQYVTYYSKQWKFKGVEIRMETSIQ